MYASYLGANQALTSDDIQGIQSVYGTRQQDAFDPSGNNSSTYATNITPYVDGTGKASLTNLDITSRSDVDWYKVTVPTAATGTMIVTMQSSRLSSLSPRIEVYYTSSLAYVGRVDAPYSYGSTVSGSLGGIKPGQEYYLRVMAANTGPSGMGGYGLQVNFSSDTQDAIAPADTLVAAQPDQNPSRTPMGNGWMVGDRFIPYLGDLVATLPGVPPIGGGLFRISYGSLSGLGEPLGVDEMADRDHHHSKGPGAGGTRYEGRHHPRPGNLPFAHGLAIAPSAPQTTAGVEDPGRGVRKEMPRRQREEPRRHQVPRLRAVDAGPDGRRAKGPAGASAQPLGGRPSRPSWTIIAEPVAPPSPGFGP